MNSFEIWVLLPGISAFLLWFIQRNRRLTTTLAVLLSTLLAILAWLLPVGEQVKLGPWSFTVAETYDLLGRIFTLTNTERPFILFIYLVTALWLLGTFVIATAPNFVPLSLAITGLLVAARAVEPFLYGALIIETAVLISVPVLYPSAEENGAGKEGRQRGVLRFLIFQILAIPFILLTGWMVPGIEDGSAGPVQPVRAAILLALGFSFWLAVFPFYSWVPMLAEHVPPYVAGFILFMLPMAVLFFGMNLISNYAWLRNLPGFFEDMRLAGTLMVAAGGLLAAFQRHLGRILGFTILILTGFSLLAISLDSESGLQIFNTQFLPVGIGLWVWVFGLSILRQKKGSLSFESVSGGVRKLPFAVIAQSLAHFTLAGLPLLAGFPLRQALYAHLSEASFAITIWVFIGNIGFLIAGLRSLGVLLVSPLKGEALSINETAGEAIFLSLGILALLAIGWFPQFILPWMVNLTKGF